jgi:hypothetical protein
MPAFAAVRGLRERHRNDPIDHRRVEGEGTGLLPSSKGQDCPGLRARAADGLALRPNREPQCLALPPPRHRKRAGARMHAWPRVAEFADAGLAAPILSIARMSLRYGARVDRPPPVVVAARPWGGTGPGARRPDPYRLLGLSQADSSVPETDYDVEHPGFELVDLEANPIGPLGAVVPIAVVNQPDPRPRAVAPRSLARPNRSAYPDPRRALIVTTADPGFRSSRETSGENRP